MAGTPHCLYSAEYLPLMDPVCQYDRSTQYCMIKVLKVFYPATVTDTNIYHALDLEWNDFEDSVQYIVGESLAVDYIVTRNTQDFTSGSIPAVTPEQFIEIITNPNEQ
jgi:hypothetical protein